MQTVTNEQIYARWEQIPESLKEAFFSTENGELIWKTCEDLGLSEEVIDQVLIVFGNVLLGFTPINDLAKELQLIPGMDPKAVDPVIFQIDRRIFAPIKGDILKLYGEMAGTGPRIVAEEAPVSKTAEEGVPAMIAEESAGQVEIRKVQIGEKTAPIETKPEAASMEGPAIMHTEAELQPVAQKKRSLSSFGGLFGFRRGEQKKEGPAVVAQVSTIEGLGKKPEEMARTEQQPVRVVHYTSAKAPEDMFIKEARPQGEAMPFVPVTKQEHEIDFEPKLVDLAAPKAEEASGSMASAVGEAQPIVVMKTPQRVEGIVPQVQPEQAPKLADIPVSGEIVDLRMIEHGEKK